MSDQLELLSPSTTPKPAWVYKPRTAEMWIRRMRQWGMPGYFFNTCVCDCRKTTHCLGTPRLHTPEGSGGGIYCLTQHCNGQKLVCGVTVPCGCWAFRVTLQDRIKLKKPKPNDWTNCARCSHPKRHHCRKRLPFKPFRCPHAPEVPESTEPYCCNLTKCIYKGASRKKAYEAKWKGFETTDGVFRCKHAPTTGDLARDYSCSSSSCAESSPNGATFCACQKFTNPLKRSPANAANSTRPRKRKPQSLAEVQLELFGISESVAGRL